MLWTTTEPLLNAATAGALAMHTRATVATRTFSKRGIFDSLHDGDPFTICQMESSPDCQVSSSGQRASGYSAEGFVTCRRWWSEPESVCDVASVALLPRDTRVSWLTGSV